MESATFRPVTTTAISGVRKVLSDIELVDPTLTIPEDPSIQLGFPYAEADVSNPSKVTYYFFDASKASPGWCPIPGIALSFDPTNGRLLYVRVPILCESRLYLVVEEL